MASESLARMHARARAVRTRATIRAWQYRQCNHAAGAWFRLRRVLADAMAIYVIADEDAMRLLAEGYQAEACGLDVEPPKTLVFVDERRLSRIAGRRQVPVGLAPAILAATALALVRFDGAAAGSRRR